MPHVAGPHGSSPSAASFLATNRGGGLFSETINQRLGSYFALLAYRTGLAPTALTIANLVLAVAASTAVVLVAPRVGESLPAWPVGVGAFLAWQIAYSLDCADGQLARVTGRASAAGGRVDLLCDLAVQISFVTAISAIAVAVVPGTPIWLVSVFAGTWLVNLMTSIMASGPGAASLISSGSLPVRIVKLIRDYGAMVTACCVVVALVPVWTIWVMAAFSLTNGAFLVMSIVQAAASALNPDGTLATSPTKGAESP